MTAHAMLDHIEALERSLTELDRIADHAADLTPDRLEPEVIEAAAILRRLILPEEAEERRLAREVGGRNLAGLLNVWNGLLDERLAELERDLEALHATGAGALGDPVGARNITRLLYEARALGHAELTAERWLALAAPAPGPSDCGEPLAHCEWCGAEYPTPE